MLCFSPVKTVVFEKKLKVVWVGRGRGPEELGGGKEYG